MLFLILIVKYNFRFRFRPKMADLFRFRLFFGRKKENLLFGYFYFTAEKVKFVFGRPLPQIIVAVETQHRLNI